MKINTQSTITSVIIGTISIITFVSQISVIQASLDKLFEGYVALFIFIIIIILIPIILLVSIGFILKTLDYIIHKRAKQYITVKLSPKSKMCLGGSIIFDVKFTSWLFAGYFTINMISPYWEEKSILLRYDDIKKQGHLKGRYDERKIQLRCNIPNDWGFGKYSIIVSIDDVCIWPLSLKKTTTMSSQNLQITISEFS